MHPTEIWALCFPVYEPNPTLPHITDRFRVQTKGRIALHGERFCSYWSKTSPKFHWLISNWLLFSGLCRCIDWGWAKCFKNWHTLALAWLSISSTVDECWLQTLMLVFSCIFFSYSRTSSIVISVKSSKLLAFSIDSVQASFFFFSTEKVLGTQNLSAEANKGFFKKQGATSFMKIAS